MNFPLILSERDKQWIKQRSSTRTPKAEFLTVIGNYTIGSTEIKIVNRFQGSYYGQPNTYLVERNGIYFHMSGPELEASTGAFPY
jgi:hypothetical protein